MGADVGGIIGAVLEEQSRGHAEKVQEQRYQEALERLKNIPIPVLQDMIAEQLGAPEAGEADPEMLAAQRAVLDRLQQWGTGALTPEDKIQQALMTDEAARRGQIEQNKIKQAMQQRTAGGGGGMGAELALQAQAAQGASQNAYQAALQNMLSARQRARESTTQAGQLAGQMSEQDYRRKRAKDAVAAANAAARQQAQQWNLNKPLTQHQLVMQKEAAMRGDIKGLGDLAQQKGERQGTGYANLGAAFGSLGGGGGGEDKSGVSPYNPDYKYEEDGDNLSGYYGEK